ncbi:catechol 2,3-dioxygenase-like lactoylglutathione lyase family enzyme [Novosphingobium hassiacum]|uniref:Catechol 2,3-dioxygenase-like lactoylglutathione lyase family enzyme n=1 Tax=Novosphingobium hassiacum TaxID=173676 RepID=A0A7W6EX81_9SPHN|nr:VOC family protein [Novosphingobium hassiacum]MBB3862113.1 catechol 2,3-dioxygenase-like lactoylglutathione lyase family enzyme [Novosphingobium hassiacum]
MDASAQPHSVVLDGKVSLDHCVIASTDLDRTDAFYEAVFGATIEKPLPLFRQYRVGAQMINVHGPGLPELAPPELVARRPVQPGNSDLCFAWDGSEAELLHHLCTCGVVITVGPEQRTGARGPGTSYYFRDPDGSLLEFIIYGHEDHEQARM